MIEACIDYKTSGTNRSACFLVSNVNILLTLNVELEDIHIWLAMMYMR
jgi:hypothetical protein